jgi:hypothetical protein
MNIAEIETSNPPNGQIRRGEPQTSTIKHPQGWLMISRGPMNIAETRTTCSLSFHCVFQSQNVLINFLYEHGQRNPGGDSKVIARGNRANPHVD